MNKDFLSIQTPYNSEDYKIMKAIVAEGFSKSEFKKNLTDNSKALWNIHESELPLIFKKLQELFNKTGNEDFLSMKEDIEKIAISENMMTCANSEKVEVDENSSDSLANQHGENLKPNTLDEAYGDRYEQIVFLQGQEAEEVMDIMNVEGEDAAFEYLKQWHYPGEHDGSATPGNGTMDKTYKKDGYIMSWNPYLPYIGLVFDTEYANQEELAEDSLTKRHQAGQREKDAPLGQHAPHSQAALKEEKDKK